MIRFFIFLMICMLPALALAQESFPLVEWEKRQLADERLTAFGTDLLGDLIDPHTGTLVFEHTDVSLPGNSGLEVAIRRRRSQGFLYHEFVDAEFADWELMVPRIKVTTANQRLWTGSRCSSSFASQFGLFTSNSTWFNGSDYSNGVMLDVPGYGSQQILEKIAQSPWPAGATHGTTGHWYFTCGSASDGGQGFIGYAPNGDTGPLIWAL